MALFTITDEAAIYTARVFANKALNVNQRFTYAALGSGTATGSVFTGAGFLHAIIFNTSAASAQFNLNDNGDSATAAAIVANASAVARYNGVKQGVDVYNINIGNGLNWRASADNSFAGVTIVYSLGT